MKIRIATEAGFNFIKNLSSTVKDAASDLFSKYGSSVAKDIENNPKKFLTATLGELDEAYNKSDSTTQSKLLDLVFSKFNIKKSSETLKNALKKEQDPFESDLYKFILEYSKKTNLDISEANANLIIKLDDQLNNLLKPYGVNGLDLSTSDFQLKALDYLKRRRIKIDLSDAAGNWLSPEKMKEKLETSSYSKSDKKVISNPTTKDDSLEKLFNLLKKVPESKLDALYKSLLKRR